MMPMIPIAADLGYVPPVANGQVEDHFDGGFLVGAAEAELCPGVTA